jgi:hypothetical protein
MPVPGDRFPILSGLGVGLGGALSRELARQPRPPASVGAELLGQLIPPRVTMLLVLCSSIAFASTMISRAI